MVSHQYININIHTYFYILLSALCKGSFNKYVDKMRWVGGPKMSTFRAKSWQPKNVHVEVGRWEKKVTLMSK